MLGAFEVDSMARALLIAAGKERTVCAECEKGDKCGASKPDNVFCSEFKRKERDKMREFKRKLTKEQYERAKKGDWDGIFSDSEIWGYGVEYQRLIHEEETDEYFVEFALGDSCD